MFDRPILSQRLKHKTGRIILYEKKKMIHIDINGYRMKKRTGILAVRWLAKLHRSSWLLYPCSARRKNINRLRLTAHPNVCTCNYMIIYTYS